MIKFLKKLTIQYSIVGLDGLYPTLNIIKFTKVIAIANKESIICAWNLIFKELKNKTKFNQLDSEHFSIWYAQKNSPYSDIEKLFNSFGGSLLNIPKKILIINVNNFETSKLENGKKLQLIHLQ